MSTNFRKTKSLSKNVRLTISKNGPSLSAGKRGARVSINKDRVRGCVGIPGIGLSYSKQKSFPKGSRLKKAAAILAGAGMLVIVAYVFVNGGF